jgi:WD40 repeat protein
VNAPANPYPGPRAFEAADGGRFFGRERELRELSALALSRRAVLLYAPSGAGKTSLLQAGLLPALAAVAGAACLPVARAGGEPPAGLTVGNLYAFNLLTRVLGDRRAPSELAGLSLRDGLAQALAGAGSPEGAPEVLFLPLDQGEEIFSFAPHRCAERAAFFEQLRDALAALPQVTLILALREDWLAHLDPFLDLLPDRLRTRVRLDLLGPEEALRAVVEPARRAGVAFQPEAARALVDDLRSHRPQGADGGGEEVAGPTVDPVQLQVVCRRLWELRAAGAAQIGAAEVAALGSVDSALADYYAAAVAGAARAAGVAERDIRRWIGRRLVAPGGLRDQVLRETAATTGLDTRAIDPLIASHLVRTERRRGTLWLELAHDRLVVPVLQDNAAWEEAHLSPLQRAADAWQRAGRPPGAVLTDAARRQAEGWAAAHRAELSAVELDFLTACRRERRQGLVRRLAAASLVLLALAATAVGLAERARQAARRDALVQRLVAQSRLALRRDLDLALLLAVAAHRTADTATTRQALLDGLTASPALAALLHGGGGDVLALAFQPRGRLLAAALADGTVQLWDPATRRPADPPLPAFSGRAWSVAWSPDGRHLAAGGEPGLRLWSTATLPPRRLPWPAGDLDLYAVAFSPDGRTLAAATSEQDVRRWDVATGAARGAPLTGPGDQVPALAWSPDGRRLAAASMDRRAYLWDAASGRLLWGAAHPRHREGLYALAFDPAGGLLATASHDGTAALWDAADGTPRAWPWSLGDLATAVAWSPDGSRLALGSLDGAITQWDVARGRQAAPVWTAAAGDLRGLAFAADGRLLASGHGATVALWDLGSTVVSPGTARRLADCDATALAATAGAVTVTCADRLRGLSAAVELNPVDLHPLHRRSAPSTAAARPRGRQVVARALSPDGRLQATADRDHRIVLWQADTGGPWAGPFPGHAEEIAGLAFAPDGRSLYSADRQGTVVRWDVDPLSWRTRACRLAGRDLTAAERQTFLPGRPGTPLCPPPTLSDRTPGPRAKEEEP